MMFWKVREMHIFKVITVDVHAYMHVYSALLLEVLPSPSQCVPSTQIGQFGEPRGPLSTQESRAPQKELSLHVGPHLLLHFPSTVTSPWPTKVVLWMCQ